MCIKSGERKIRERQSITLYFSLLRRMTRVNSEPHVQHDSTSQLFNLVPCMQDQLSLDARKTGKGVLKPNVKPSTNPVTEIMQAQVRKIRRARKVVVGLELYCQDPSQYFTVGHRACSILYELSRHLLRNSTGS